MSYRSSPIPGPVQRSPEWRAMRLFDADRERPVVFGASEAAEALGVSPYSSGPLELYLRKRGEKPAPEETEAMFMGRVLEKPVLELYAHRTGVRLAADLPMYFHGRYYFMAASPDALAYAGVHYPDDLAAGEPIVVDSKTSTFRRHDAFGIDSEKFGVEGSDQLPPDYLLQAQQLIEVMGVDQADFPVLFDGRTMRIYRVERNDDLIAALVSAERELAERIIQGDPPEPHWEHPKTRECLRLLYGHEPGTTVVLSLEAARRWHDIALRKAQIAELVTANEADQNRILAELGSAECGQLSAAGRKELRRLVVRDSVWTERDVQTAIENLGGAKRRGYERLIERRIVNQ